MAQNSFDIVSEIDLQEVDNAVNQTLKEILQRYDFKGTNTSIDLNKKEKLLTLHTSDEFHLKALIDSLQNKMIKRSVPIKALKFEKIEESSGNSVRQVVKLLVGIDKDNARVLTKMIKDMGAKVQAQIMDDQVRVTGKNKDDLQAVITHLKQADLPFAIQFTNYR